MKTLFQRWRATGAAKSVAVVVVGWASESDGHGVISLRDSCIYIRGQLQPTRHTVRLGEHAQCSRGAGVDCALTRWGIITR
jgi:hypothetical protein